MEVKPGYKQTEVGVIPEDWESISVGNIASFASGQGINTSSLTEESSDTPIPVYGGNGIAGYTDEALIGEPTVVVGRVGQKCGEVYLTEGPSWITDNALYPRQFLSNIDLRFLALAMKAAGLNNLKNRNDLPLVTQAILHSVVLCVPTNTTEQRAIASALSDVDALLAGLDRLIAKKRDLKQAAIQQLLTGKTRLTGFHGEWEVKSLGEIGTFLKGGGVKKDQARSGHLPCIRYGEIYTHHNDYIRSFTSWISPEIAATATRLKQGDLLFAGSGETKEEIGKCVAVIEDCEAYAGGDIVILRLIDAHPMFMGYYCNTTLINAQKSSKGQGDAVVHISAAALASIQVTLPPRSEQVAIAAVLSDMDAEINALEARRDKTRALKQAMMQELLTGNIRLVQSAVTAKVETQDRTHTNIHFKRSVLAAEIISQLHNEPTFGHVKLEKMIFLVEHLCEVDTGSTYHRHAAGPYDGKALRSIDSQIKKQRWFRAEYQGKGFRYIPMDRTGEHAQYFERYFSAIREQFNGIIAKFRTFNTERCGIVATLYSAWNDLIQQGKTVSDEAILIEVLERWNESKQMIPKDRWLKALEWMRENQLVPRGGDHAHVK